MISSLMFVLLFSTVITMAGTGFRGHDFDVTHYRIEISCDFNAGRVDGTTTLTMQAYQPGLQKVMLDAVKFDVKNVMLNKRQLDSFTVNDKSIEIILPQPAERGAPFNIAVQYSCAPEKGLYFVGPDEDYPDKPRQIWSQGEGEDNRYWFPAYDSPNDKATMEMIVYADAGETVVSNGKLVDKKKDDKSGKTRWYFKLNKPTPAYLISLIIGNYQKFTDRFEDIPVEYYVYPRHSKTDAWRSFGKTPRMIKFFSEQIGFRYPYPKYAQTIISEFMYGGMENISATTQTDRTMHDERAHLDTDSDGLVAHELAHQWWGDLVTCREWDEIWINEGFATYFTDLWFEHDRGRDEFNYRLYKKLKSVSRYELREPRHLIGGENWGAYVLGSSVLHMLRYYLGDELFWASMNRFAVDFAWKNADSRDLQRAVEDATGRNMTTFFEQWVYGAGIPELKVDYFYNAGEQLLNLHVVQQQDSFAVRPVFEMPLNVQLVTDNEKRVERINLDQREQSFEFTLSEAPRLVDVDYGPWYLKKLDFDKSDTELIFQAMYSDNVASRIRALEQIAEKDSLEMNDELANAVINRLKNDPFYGVRISAAETIAELKLDSFRGPLMDQLKKEKKSKVRSAIVEALGNYPREAVISTLLNVLNSDESYFVRADAVGALAKIKPENIETILRAALQQESWDETVRRAVLEKLDVLETGAQIELLEEYSRYGIHPRLRRMAVYRLGKLAAENEAAVELLKQVARTKDHLRYRPASSAVSALAKLDREDIRDFLKELKKTATHPYVKRALERALAEKEDKQQQEREVLVREKKMLQGKLRLLEKKLEKFTKSNRS